MKELIPKDEFGIFADSHDTARVDSLFVAEFFGKLHQHVLRDIRKITDEHSGLSREFAESILDAGLIRMLKDRNVLCTSLQEMDSRCW